MAKVEVTVCDVCRDPGRKVSHFSVTGDEASGALDLCEEHAAPLLDLLQRGTMAPKVIARVRATSKRATAKVAPARRKRAGFDAAVRTMEEIEASKRA